MTYSWDGEDYMYVAKDTEITLPKEWPENLKIINQTSLNQQSEIIL